MAISHLTKPEILKQLEETRKYVKDLEKQVEALERYKKYEEAADEIKALHDSYVNAGFTEEQAFQLTMTAYNGVMKHLWG